MKITDAGITAAAKPDARPIPIVSLEERLDRYYALKCRVSPEILDAASRQALLEVEQIAGVELHHAAMGDGVRLQFFPPHGSAPQHGLTRSDLNAIWITRLEQIIAGGTR